MGKIESIIKGAKGIGSDLKWLRDNTMTKVAKEDVAKDGIGLYQHLAPYKLKGGVAGTIAAGAIAVNAGSAALQSHNVAQMGAIEAGEGLSGMTSTVAKSPLLDKLQKGEYAEDRVMGSIDNAGADGDIVFALHNMR
jgi:hypothetical protein